MLACVFIYIQSILHTFYKINFSAQILYYHNNIMATISYCDTSSICEVIFSDSLIQSKFKIIKIIQECKNKVSLSVRCKTTKKRYFLKMIVVDDVTEVKKYENVLAFFKKNKHKNIENILDYYYVNEILIVQSEYIDGCNASESNKINYKIMLNDIFSGLSFMHCNNIIHCDIKPENIMISDERYIIVDFEYAKECLNYVKTETVCGTQFYISPETYSECVYSKKSDVWSLGITMFKIITGKYPFEFDRICHLHYLRNYDNLQLELLDECNVDKNILLMVKKMLNISDKNRPSTCYIA